MHAHHPFGPRCRIRNLVNIKRGGIGSQHNPRPRRLIQTREDLLLHLHILEHRFDHQIGFAHGFFEIGRTAQQRAALFIVSLGQAARSDSTLPIRLTTLQALGERFFSHFHNGDGHAEIRGAHRNTAAHGAAADHDKLANRQHLRISRQAGDALRFAFTKEDMAQRLGLFARHQACE